MGAAAEQDVAGDPERCEVLRYDMQPSHFPSTIAR